MKPSISKKTADFLQSIESRVEEDIVNYVAGKDELDRIIFKDGLLIRNLYIDKPFDLMILVLNTRKIIKRKISDFDLLQKASSEQLNDFVISGIGIHWPKLDYDLSLKGFLEYELLFVDKPFSI